MGHIRVECQAMVASAFPMLQMVPPCVNWNRRSRCPWSTSLDEFFVSDPLDQACALSCVAPRPIDPHMKHKIKKLSDLSGGVHQIRGACCIWLSRWLHCFVALRVVRKILCRLCRRVGRRVRRFWIAGGLLTHCWSSCHSSGRSLLLSYARGRSPWMCTCFFQ